MTVKQILGGVCMLAVMGALAFAGAGGGGAPGAPGGAPGGGRGRGGPPANIAGAMRDMGAMLTAIKKEAADPAQTEQTLKDLATFERDVSIAKTQTPPTNNVDAANKEKAPADFRAAMTKLQHVLLDLEDAVAAKKPDDIKKCIAALDDIEKAGHAEFKVGQ